MMVSLAGNLNILILAASTQSFSRWRNADKLPAGLAIIHPRCRTPVVSILLTTAVMLVLTLSGTFIYLLTLSTLSRLLTYLATCTAVPLLRKRATSPSAGFLMPGGVALATLGTSLSLWLLSNSTLREAYDTTAATAMGVIIYCVNPKAASATEARVLMSRLLPEKSSDSALRISCVQVGGNEPYGPASPASGQYFGYT